jgi:hypothetical protein
MRKIRGDRNRIVSSENQIQLGNPIDVSVGEVRDRYTSVGRALKVLKVVIQNSVIRTQVPANSVDSKMICMRGTSGADAATFPIIPDTKQYYKNK